MKLKNQKGATGTDIIISITIIVLSITIVSMIYVNTTLQSRNVTRTAGATRIATNIIENINKLSYSDFVAEYNSSKWTSVTTGNYVGYRTSSGVTTFGTKIPRGYTVYLYGEPNYGSHEQTSEQFDLVRDVKLVVEFKVGDVERKVDFSTSKSREIIEEVNEPVTSILVSQKIINSDNKKFYLIKYLDEAKSYVKTTENDRDWYDYPNKKWAMVIVSTEAENTLFDVNGKLVADSSKYVRYTWIPKYFYSGTGDDKVISEFAYQSSSDIAIKSKQELKAVDNTTILYYNTFGPKKDTSIEADTFMLSGNKKISGKWILAGNLEDIESDSNGKLLNNSIYGPCEIH